MSKSNCSIYKLSEIDMSSPHSHITISMTRTPSPDPYHNLKTRLSLPHTVNLEAAKPVLVEISGRHQLDISYCAEDFSITIIAHPGAEKDCRLASKFVRNLLATPAPEYTLDFPDYMPRCSGFTFLFHEHSEVLRLINSYSYSHGAPDPALHKPIQICIYWRTASIGKKKKVNIYQFAHLLGPIKRWSSINKWAERLEKPEWKRSEEKDEGDIPKRFLYLEFEDGLRARTLAKLIREEEEIDLGRIWVEAYDDMNLF